MKLFRQVLGEGSLAAKIVVIAEAPANQEVIQGRPLVGYSGHKQNEIWDSVGIRRVELRIENVSERQAPGNKIARMPKDELAWWIADLHLRLAKLKDPYVIVPTGNTALFALTGQGRNPIGKYATPQQRATNLKQGAGITNWRGSILTYMDLKKRTIKVVPTFHAAYALYDPSKEIVMRLDWKRIAEEAKTKELDLPVRHHMIDPTTKQFDRFAATLMMRARGGPVLLSIDIETPGGSIYCVAFSFHPSESITINADTEEHRRWINELCSFDCDKVLQNGVFDAYYLAQEGFTLTRYVHDTLDAHHCLSPRLPHSLAFMASVDTRQPRWKAHDEKEDKGKDGQVRPTYANPEGLKTLCGLDACVTLELMEIYQQRLRERGLGEFYRRHYQDLIAPRLAMMLQGIPVNVPAMKAKRAKLIDDLERIREKLERIAGTSLWGKKGGFSNPKLSKLLYVDLKLPRQYNRKTRARTADGGLPTTANEVALCRLRIKAEERGDVKARRVIRLLLRFRMLFKRRDILSVKKVDSDGVMRCTYKNATLVGRFSSSKNPRRHGMNLQNVDKKLRPIFIPTHADKGWVFLEVDLSQADDRFVGMLTRDPASIKGANRPATTDKYTMRAAEWLGIAQEEVTKDLRDAFKIAAHAGNYDEGAQTLSDSMLKEANVVKSLAECQAALNQVKTLPILNWHGETRRRLVREGFLINSWGRLLDFRHMKLDINTYHDAYAFVPSSETADLLNQWGLKPAFTFVKEHPWVVLNAQVHDSLLFSVRPLAIYIAELVQMLAKTLERPRLFYGKSLIVPCSFKIGQNWGKMIEWKHCPSVEEIAEALAALPYW